MRREAPALVQARPWRFHEKACVYRRPGTQRAGIHGRRVARVFEMTLQRVGDTDWPSAGAISPQ